MNLKIAFLITLLLLQLPSGAQAAGLVVLAQPSDPYYPLAEEIAQAEAAPLVHSWDEALAANPVTILWVTDPGQLSDEAAAAAGMALKKHPALPRVGIITGTTQESARQLWLRGQELRAKTWDGAPARFFAANGEHPTAGSVQAQLIEFQDGGPRVVPLDHSTMSDALSRADYLTFTGHGGDSYLRLDPETTYGPNSLPELPPVIVSTGSCQTLRIWEPGSIALAFVRKGAAAFAGSFYSPMAGYLIGQFDELPFRYTWPDFPIGQVMALQTRGTMQGYANFPFFFLIGDPRIALQDSPPYRVALDEVSGSTRTLVLEDVPQGIIPLHVPGGGRYRYVSVEGLAATADGDPFFSSRIQAASLGGDKYILVNHPGGNLTLRLRETAPWYWMPLHALASAFDHVTLFIPQNGGDILMAAAGIVFLVAALLRELFARRKGSGLSRRAALTALAAALIVTLLLGLYQAARLPHAAITTKPMAFSPVWLAAVFLLTLSGSGLFLLARSLWGKIFGLLVAVFPALLPAVFIFAVMQVYNLALRSITGAGVYNLHMSTLPAIAAAAWALALLAGLWLAKRWVRDV